MTSEEGRCYNAPEGTDNLFRGDGILGKKTSGEILVARDLLPSRSSATGPPGAHLTTPRLLFPTPLWYSPGPECAVPGTVSWGMAPATPEQRFLIRVMELDGFRQNEAREVDVPSVVAAVKDADKLAAFDRMLEEAHFFDTLEAVRAKSGKSKEDFLIVLKGDGYAVRDLTNEQFPFDFGGDLGNHLVGETWTRR